MLRINCKQLPSVKTLKALQAKQGKLDALIGFEAQSKQAAKAWKSGPPAAAELKSCLYSGSVSLNICNYCEANESTDVEHIYPKTLFPGRTFVFDNYLMSCGKCNSHHKSDGFQVFVPAGGSQVVDITPQKQNRVYTAPASTDALFIDPRREDPMDFLRLELRERTFFYAASSSDPNSREYLRAAYTINLLALNARSSLVRARENAFRFFAEHLKLAAQVAQASSKQDVKDLVTNDIFTVDTQLPLTQLKEWVLAHYRQTMLSYAQPTVWAEMKRQRQHLPHTNSLFIKLPEALAW